MSRLRFAAVAVLGVLALSACNTTGTSTPEQAQIPVSGPAAEFTPPPAGSTFKMLDDTYRVVGSDANTVTLLHEKSGKDVTIVGGVIPFWNIERRNVDLSEVASLWPIQVGKTARVKVSQKVGATYWHDDIQVLRREKITVPAGTFDTYVIRVTETSSNNGYKGENMYWYAPEIGMPVKRDFRYIKGNGTSKDFVLQDANLNS